VNRLDLTISELKSQIVSSPDKLQASIKELQFQLQRETEMLRDHEAKERQTTNKINLLGQYSLVRLRCFLFFSTLSNKADWECATSGDV
jgi:hypothetical protein